MANSMIYKRKFISSRLLFIFIIGIIMIVSFGCVKSDKSPDLDNISDEYKAVDNSRIYYTNNITKEDVEALIRYLNRVDYFKDDTVYMKLDKSNFDEYAVYLCVYEFEINSKSILEYYQGFTDDISFNVFNDKKVTIHLCYKDFIPIKSISTDD